MDTLATRDACVARMRLAAASCLSVNFTVVKEKLAQSEKPKGAVVRRYSSGSTSRPIGGAERAAQAREAATARKVELEKQRKALADRRGRG